MLLHNQNVFLYTHFDTYVYSYRKKINAFNGKHKRIRRNAFAKYVPLNSLTLSRLNQLKPGNGAADGGSQPTSSEDPLKDQKKTPNENNDVKNSSNAKKSNNSILPWWKQFPKKTKNKNKQILNELNKITEALPEWPWVNSLSKQSKLVINYISINLLPRHNTITL